VRTLIAIDVSTALLNQLTEDDDIFNNGRDLLRGYLSIADLDDKELRLIPHLVMGRVIARTLLTISRAELLPEKADYILRNTAQGWRQLGWFLKRDSDEISNLLIKNI